MDDNGNILARRYSKSLIFVKGAVNSMGEETAIGNEILKSQDQMIEQDKVMKVIHIVLSNMFHKSSIKVKFSDI